MPIVFDDHYFIAWSREDSNFRVLDRSIATTLNGGAYIAYATSRSVQRSYTDEYIFSSRKANR